MSYRNNFHIKIPQKEIPGYVNIYGMHFTPHTKTHATIVFTPGFSTKVEKFDDFLEPLSDKYEIIAYNPRSNGSINKKEVPRSEGVLNAKKCTSDLIEICNKYTSSKLILMGHSMGAALSIMAEKESKTSALVFFSPYISAYYLPTTHRIGYKLLLALQNNDILDKLEWVLFNKTVIKSIGLEFYLDYPLQSSLATHEITMLKSNHKHSTIRKTNIPMLYFLSDQDEVLRTKFHPLIFKKYNKTLSMLSPKVENGNELVSGLNHCFNKIPYDNSKFCKDKNKRDTLVARINDFLEKQN